MKKLNHQERLEASIDFEERKLEIIIQCGEHITNSNDTKQKKSFLLKKRRKLIKKTKNKIDKLKKELDRLLL